MIKLQNINFGYSPDKKVFDDFCAEFKADKISCILGGSGEGKTTLLNLLAGLIKPQSGEIIGIENSGGQGISYVFQQPRLIPKLTVFENLEFVLCSVYKDKKERLKEIEDMLKSAGILDVRDNYPASLSGGMSQRVSLARAFLYPSELLLLDEPFVGLDIKIKDEIVKLLLSLLKASKRTVIYVTHDITDALSIADDIFVLKQNKLIKSSPNAKELRDLIVMQ